MRFAQHTAISFLAGRYAEHGDTFRKPLLLLQLALWFPGHLRKHLDADASLISQRPELGRSSLGPRGGFFNSTADVGGSEAENSGVQMTAKVLVKGHCYPFMVTT